MKKLGWFLCAGFLFSCSARMHSAKTMHTFDSQGHRGCRGLMPENTIPAMLHALELGVQTLEMDAVITSDGKVILSHEPFFNHEISTTPLGNRVTIAEEKQLNIFQMNYAEIQRYDVGLAAHPRFPRQKRLPAVKPLLTDVIDSVKAYCEKNKRDLPYFNIETKSDPAVDGIYHPLPAEFVDRLMQVIQLTNIQQKVIIQSFDPRTLQYLHEKFPFITTALLIEDTDSRSLAIQLQQLGFIPSIYSPAYKWVTPLLVKQCSEMGMRLIPWTVNDLPTLQRLKDMGVNGIISDYPDLFSQLK